MRVVNELDRERIIRRRMRLGVAAERRVVVEGRERWRRRWKWRREARKGRRGDIR